MKILSGKYKGIKIKTSSKFEYRPTQSIVRKSIFDTLGVLDNCSVLDLFSGTGILGFESASRGASSVTFVENNLRIFRQLKENVFSFSEEQFILIKKDVLKFIKNCQRYNLIIADPPYNFFNQNKKVNVDLFIEMIVEKLYLGGVFVLECPKSLSLDYPVKIKNFGETKICIGEKV